MSEGLRFICASAGGHRVAFSVEDVQAAIGLRPVTRLFYTPPAVRGVINLRGEIVPVLDLAALVGPTTASRPSDERARILVFSVVFASTSRAGRNSGERRRTAIAVEVDELEPIRIAEPTAVQPLPSGVGGVAARLASGVLTLAGTSHLIIDPLRLVALPEIASLRGESGDLAAS